MYSYIWLTRKTCFGPGLISKSCFPTVHFFCCTYLTSSERPEHWMKEEACRNSIHCNNTEFLHRAFCIFLFVSALLWRYNGTTGINMMCANSNGYLEKRRVNTVAPVAMNSLLSRYAFVWRQERRDDSGLFHDPQIFFYKFKSDDSIHCWITL